MSHQTRSVVGALPGVKLCRLCEDTSGPFLNIFDVDIEMSSKIRKLLTIEISEWDDLPHKICFRCSAKVTELHEFVEKCLQTQKSLLSKFEIKSTVKNDKVKHIRSSWESKLMEKNMSNDEYCDQLIQKALASLPTLQSETSSLNSIPIKDARIVLSRIDDKPFKPNNSSHAVKPITRSTPLAEKLSENFTSLNVTGIGSIFICKKCEKILENKQSAFKHICPKENQQRPTLNNKLETTSNKMLTTSNKVQTTSNKLQTPNNELLTSNQNESINILENANISRSLSLLNQSSQSVAHFDSDELSKTASSLAQQNKFLVKLPDNTYVLLHVMDNVSPNSLDTTISKAISTFTNSNQQSNSTQRIGYTNSSRTRNLINSEKEFKTSTKLQLKSKTSVLPQKSKSSEPYPVGLFCRTQQDSNPLAGPSQVDELANSNTLKKTSEKRQKDISKQYKVTSRDSHSKIVISNINSQQRAKKINPLSSNQQKPQVKSQSLNQTSVTSGGDSYFTFVDIDPISNPLFVLPTDNIVQESQISTTAVAPMPPKKQKKNTRKRSAFNRSGGGGDHVCYICEETFHKSAINQFVSHMHEHSSVGDDK